MRETRGALLACALLLILQLGPSTCQRQVESRRQQTSWGTGARHLPSNLVSRQRVVQEPISSASLEREEEEQRQSASAEYYDDEEYYDDQERPLSSAEQSSRESKAVRQEAPRQQQQSAADAAAQYEDSYYYDDDYEELPADDVPAKPAQGSSATRDETEERPEEAAPASEEHAAIAEAAPINRTALVHNEDSPEPEPGSAASISPENTSTTVAPTSAEPTSSSTSTTSTTTSTSTTSTTTSTTPSTTTSTTTTTTSTTTPSTTTSTTTQAVDEEEEKDVEEEKESDDPSEGSILIGEAIVSVVTTKSVVNGTFSIPEDVTFLPPTYSMDEESVEATSSAISSTTEGTTSTTSTTTEFAPSSTIVASVQTGRSVSGARFLPFPSVDKVDQLDSTESIIDKLDRVQSELSSGFLANNRFVPRRYNKKPFSATSLTLPTTTTIAPTSSPIIPPLVITSITKRPRVQTTQDDVAALLPKDFKSFGSSSTTKRPKFQTTLEDVSAFLPKDYKGFTASTTAAPSTKRPKLQTTLDDVAAFLPKDYQKSYRAGSTTRRPKFQTTLDDVDAFLPKDFPKNSYRSANKRPSYKTTSTTASSTTGASTAAPPASTSTDRSTASTRPKALTTIEDINAFLPPGYKLKKEEASTEKSSILSDILAKSKITGAEESSPVATSTTEKTKSIEDLFVKSAVDISALLPPGYKPEASSPKPSTAKPSGDPISELLNKSSVDLSALLPSGHKPAAGEAESGEAAKSGDPLQELLTKSKVDLSALLPPGFMPPSDSSGEQSTAKSSAAGGSGSFKVVFPSRPGGRKPIHKITTPSSKAATGAEPVTPRIQKGWPTRATTEFTGWPSSSTTPISIEKLLEAARTATVPSTNVSVEPITDEITSTSSTTTTTTTTMRPTTPGICDEDCEVAGTIKIVENATWVPELLDRNTREWQDLAEEIEREMNLVFAKSPVLRKWFRNIRIDSFSQGSILVDYFVELADLKEKVNTQQLKVIFHDSLRTFNSDNPMEATPKGPMKLGKFIIDPKSTDFVVIPRVAAPKISEDENRLIPQWAIAVIVIGVGGLLFIIVFGVSVLVNRQYGSKLKPPITAMYEEEMSKNAMSHAGPPSRPASEYHKNESQMMWNDPGWHDKPFESTSHKILVDGLPYERKYNPYDSWKSEWNGYYYPPTQASGSNFSRHHPDYDF